jgi:hypothetical protein
VSIALLIAPIWLIVLWLIAGLCLAAHVGDQQRYIVEEQRRVDDGRGGRGGDLQPAALAGRQAA